MTLIFGVGNTAPLDCNNNSGGGGTEQRSKSMKSFIASITLIFIFPAYLCAEPIDPPKPEPLRRLPTPVTDQVKIKLLSAGNSATGAPYTIDFDKQDRGEVISPPEPTTIPLEQCPNRDLFLPKHWDGEYREKLTNGPGECVATLTPLKNKRAEITLAQYRYTFGEGESATQMQLNALVRNADKALLWRYLATELPSGSLESAQIVNAGSRELIEFKFFTGGTAGYWEQHLWVNDSGLQPASKSFRESAGSLVPDGYAHQRTYITFPDLNAVISLAKKGDPNCCPSGRLELKLAIQENDFALVSGQFHEVPVEGTNTR